MKIGIDASFLARDSRGMGRVTKSLINLMLADTSNKYYFLTPLHKEDQPKILKMYGEKAEFLTIQDADRLDVVWYPWNRIDFLPKCRRVVTIHDVAMFRYFPHNKIDSYNDRQRIRKAVSSADIIVTVSEFSKSEIITFLEIQPSIIKVIPNGVDSNFMPSAPENPIEFLNTFADGQNYILFVGSPDKRKDLKTLLLAFDIFKKKTGLPHKLLLASNKPSLNKTNKFTRFFLKTMGQRPEINIISYIEDKMEFKKDVIWLGNVSDGDLVKLYNQCSVFVFPSLYEGFGIPVLEAFSCRAPVIASDIPVFREIGGDAPFYFTPSDPEDLANKINKVVTSPQIAKLMKTRGAERLQYFSWQRSCDEYLKLFNSLR